MERHPIIAQYTMRCIEDTLLSEGRCLRTKRNKKKEITSIGVFGYTNPDGPCKEQPEPVIVEEYYWSKG